MVCKPLMNIKCPNGEIQRGDWYKDKFVGRSQPPRPWCEYEKTKLNCEL